jgi:hypothetical protein
MDFGIGKALSDGNGNALIFTAVASAALANCIPTPADAIYFWRQQVDKQELEDNKITPKQYWTRDVIGYYGYTAAWYALVLTTMAAVGGTYQTKARILLGLLGAGVVIGVVAKNIQKDEELKNLNK